MPGLTKLDDLGKGHVHCLVVSIFQLWHLVSLEGKLKLVIKRLGCLLGAVLAAQSLRVERLLGLDGNWKGGFRLDEAMVKGLVGLV